MRALGAVILALLIAGCASGNRQDTSVEQHLTLAEMAASNQSNLMKLSVGMSKEEVIALMGKQSAKTNDGVVNNPWTVETFVVKDSAQYEGFYYVTRKNQPFTPVRKSLTTAIVFKNGKVVGWGENAFDRLR